MKYKYILDIDGNSVSWTRLPFIMIGGAVPLRPESEFKQWFHGDIKPYVHYVPIKDDLSDLVEQIEWLRQNDDKAREIQENGLAFAKKHFKSTALDKAIITTLQQYEELYVKSKKEHQSSG